MQITRMVRKMAEDVQHFQMYGHAPGLEEYEVSVCYGHTELQEVTEEKKPCSIYFRQSQTCKILT